MLDSKFLSILACPCCDSRPPLTQKDQVLHCGNCGRDYPIVDGIPHLLPEDGILPTGSTS